MWDFILKYKWTILLVAAIIILLIVAYKRGWFGTTSKTPFKPVSSGAGSSSTTVLTGGNCATDASFPLKVGSKGKQVGALQKYINYILAQNGSDERIGVDCVFGSKETLPKVKEGIGQEFVSESSYISYNIKEFE